MLPINRVIVSLVYYNSLIRDTLEYSIHRDKFDVNFYNYKKNGIVNEPLLNTPLKSFLDSNGEKGEALRKEILEFGETFYSDKSTVLRVDNDTIKVDHNQDVMMFEKIIPLHEQINAVIKVHEKYAQDHNQVEESITKLLEADEKFYRAVVLFSLLNIIMRKFNEFNKEMRDAQGQKGPAASFIEQELNTLVRMFYISKQQATCKNAEYTDALDLIEHLIEMMNGKRELPKGKNFNDVFAEANAKANEFIILSEDTWKIAYTPAVQEMIKDNQEARAKQEASQTAE